MAKRPVPTSKKLVWRISERAPLGELVDSSAPPPDAPIDTPLPEASQAGGWIVSSFELLNGIDVSDGPDTVTDDLFDALFPDSGRPPPSGDQPP